VALSSHRAADDPGKFLFGGCGLASGIVALEEASARPTIYAAAHYLSFAPLGAEVNVEVDLAVVGNRVTQARATTYCEEREVLTVNAALGTGELNAPVRGSPCPRFRARGLPAARVDPSVLTTRSSIT